MAERGLGEEVLRAFGVGYAPSAWDKVLLRGQRAGFKVDELRGVGLAQRGRSGGEYDRFRSRIIFPIKDRRGRTLGFGGRAMRSDQGAKYVNTAETDFFHKSQMLYGIDLAKAAIAKAGRAVVVEGYTDVLALHQAGIEEAVGVMGTAITEEQVATLSGMVEEVVLALDADSAGQEAMLRAQRVAAGRQDADPGRGDAGRRGPGRDDGRRGRRRALPGPGRGRGRALRLPGRPGARPHRRLLALRARPGAERGGPDHGGDGRRRRAAKTLERRVARAARPRPGDGDGPRGHRAAAERRPQPRRGPRSRPRARAAGSPPQRAAAALTSRERRERALLAMCIAMPAEGKEFLDALTEAHLSPLGARALAWLREHPEDPASNLPQDDDELAGLIAELVILANSEPASPDAKRAALGRGDASSTSCCSSSAASRRRSRPPARPATASAAPPSAWSAPPWSNASPAPSGSVAELGKFPRSFRGSSIGRARDC